VPVATASNSTHDSLNCLQDSPGSQCGSKSPFKNTLLPYSLGLFCHDSAIKFPIYIEIVTWQVFSRFKELLMEPSAFNHAERHDNILATVLS
jgi:hypothetical protein